MKLPAVTGGGAPLAVAALGIYLCGGLFTFGGLFLTIRRWFTAGPSALGGALLTVVAGLLLSMIGVLCMRIVRNRGRR